MAANSLSAPLAAEYVVVNCFNKTSGGISRAAPICFIIACTKTVAAGFSTAQEETAQMTGGDYTRNIRQRAIEAKQKREVDEIINPPQQAAERTGGNNNA